MAERKGGDNGEITEIEKIFLAIYGPMIDTAPNVMVWMWADSLLGQMGGGWTLEIETLGPVKWHRSVW